MANKRLIERQGAGQQRSGHPPTAGWAWLQVRTTGQPDAQVEIRGSSLTIGRAPGNGLLLHDPFVSSRHAEIVVHEGTPAVRDLGSSNGSRLNGRPIAPGVLHPLRDGDTLQFGDTALVYHPMPAVAPAPLPGQPPAAPPPPAPSPKPAPQRSRLPGRLLGAVVRLVLVLLAVAILTSGILWLFAPSRMVLLVLGSDARPDEIRRNAVGRTDTLMAVVADSPGLRQSAGLTMLSVPRDLWVPITGYGEERVNAAYALGGARAAERTVGDVLGVSVSRSLVIGLQGVRDIVDAAGGVEIEVAEAIHDDAYPTDDYGTIVIDIPAGRQWMDGETALRYARTRHQDSDFGRMARQQQVISALRTRLLQPWNWWRVPAVALAVRDATQTNLWPTDMLTLGLAAVTASDGPVRLTPDHQLVEEFRGRDGAYLLRPRPALKQRVGVLLSPATASVEILNGSLTAGAAGQAAETLRGQGLKVTNVGNAAGSQPETTIEVCGGCQRAGRLVASALGVPATAVRENPMLPAGTDVRATLGVNGR